MRVKVIGSGLAGSEAAYQLARRGIKVDLYEQKGVKRHEAFKTDLFAELLCSNSLRSNELTSGVGLLKEEMRRLDSLIMEAAEIASVGGGSALAVDRVAFSSYITEKIKSHPNITLHTEEVKDIDTDEFTLVAAGPLCDGDLSMKLKELCGKDYLYFYDAVSPIVEKSSIDFDKAYYKSRYEDEGSGEYINCPLSKEEFNVFYREVVSAKCIDVRDMDKEIYFEGCMPFEAMAKRGFKTLLFGPMKPVGLERAGERPYAVVQLRKDNAIDTLYNVVGFQTHLTFPEQLRVLRLVPALRNVNIVRYGVMHRNTYINSPKVINDAYQFVNYPKVFVAGQISGVEGYVESAASGLYAAIMMAQYVNGGILDKLGADSMMGAMAAYISDVHLSKLVPMNANFSLFKFNYDGPKDKRKQAIVDLALKNIDEFAKRVNV